jgi:hypothetical protein
LTQTGGPSCEEDDRIESAGVESRDLCRGARPCHGSLSVTRRAGERRRAILDCSARGDIVLDAFLGQRTTVIASSRPDHLFRGRKMVAEAPARQASPQVQKLTIQAASCDVPPNLSRLTASVGPDD